MLKFLGGTLIAVAALGCVDQPEQSAVDQLLGHDHTLPNNVPFRNPTGYATTISTAGSVDLTNEFFQDLGTNGRRCVTCHLPSAGWGITPSQVQAVFEATRGGAIDDGFGLGAIFRLNDGANSPSADVSTLAKRRVAYSMLLTKGLIRVGIGIPANAEFDLVTVDDPYGHASAAELSLFRRPLPTTNLKFLSAVMWDGRETFPGQSIHFDLADQSNGATVGHAQGSPISTAQRESIVALETALHTGQIRDDRAGELDEAGATGGPAAIVTQNFFIGINDLFPPAVFTPIVFTLYDAWANLPSNGEEGEHHGRHHGEGDDDANSARRAVARGQALFNTRVVHIEGVSGINDEAAFGKPASVAGTCTTCHDSPNAGNHSVVAPLNIGLVDASRRTPDMPLYTFRCNAAGVTAGNCTAGQTITVTDPGRALISGKFKHIGRFKGPILRGLASRAPYFHNGSAANLDAAVDFYNTRFNMGLSAQEHSDIVAFLRTL